MNSNETLRMTADAFTYAYPIVGMYELLNAQVLDVKTAVTGLNEFSHTAAVASPKTSFIPAPNNDTSYSRAWLDLRNEPVILAMPDTQDRYYSIQFLNLFSETLANVGRRTTGTHAQKFAVVGPTWNQKLPEDMLVIKSDTTFVLAFLRILIHGEQDVQAVKEIQRNIHICTLSGAVSDASGLPAYKTNTKKEFFETASKVLSITPFPQGEEKNVDAIHACMSARSEQLEAGCNLALEEIALGGMEFGEDCNFWRIARKGIGNYGNDYFQRSVVWHKGALANRPDESLYPSTFQDSTGQLLDGNAAYTLTFPKGSLPPVSQFWSLTMYLFRNAFLHDNEIDRYSIGDRTENLAHNADGSMTIYIQNKAPANPNERANWLPAPAEKFFLVLRLYGPSQEVIDGSWVPPTVEKR